jgi:hypothetical protein
MPPTRIPWTEPDASGLQSLVWRAAWEQAGEEVLKQKLLQYNLEDCSALRRVTESLLVPKSGKAIRVTSEECGNRTRVEDISTGGAEVDLSTYTSEDRCHYIPNSQVPPHPERSRRKLVGKATS